jgi:hypothetical protein
MNTAAANINMEPGGAGLASTGGGSFSHGSGPLLPCGASPQPRLESWDTDFSNRKEKL